jgi:hypothetical protein
MSPNVANSNLHQADIMDDDTSVSTSSTPDEFVCPISLCVMKDPVVSKFGQNYDRKAILQWLKGGHDSCPLTRQPLKPSLLVPNTNLKMNILKWKMDHQKGHADPSGGDAANDDDESTSCFSIDGFIGTVDVSDNRRKMEGSRPNSSSRRRRRRESEDDLSDLLALYEEVLELTAPAGHGSTLTTSSDPIATDPAATGCSSGGDCDDDDDLRDILQLYNEVLELTEGP